MTIALIVDDEEHERGKIESYLASRGLTYLTAKDPLGARDMMARHAFDFLFLDLDLGAGIGDGEGILAWMDRHDFRVPTVIVSEAAALPRVIRLEKSYERIVRFRMTHGDLEQLGDLVDKLMAAIQLPETRADRDNHAEEPAAHLTPRERTGHWQIFIFGLAVVAALALVIYLLGRTAGLVVVGGTVVMLLVIVSYLLAVEGSLKSSDFRKVAVAVIEKMTFMGSVSNEGSRKGGGEGRKKPGSGSDGGSEP